MSLLAIIGEFIVLLITYEIFLIAEVIWWNHDQFYCGEKSQTLKMSSSHQL